ncbi:MAG: DUF4271 domain-containing protein [Bacteroidaceae bacterium]|nr:DUF4271 domain-containing protein [Bacteroidaceae bacterium]
MKDLERFLSTQPADDWTLLTFLVLLIVTSLLLGPYLNQLRISLVYVYKIRNSNGEFKTLILPPAISFALAVVSVSSISFASALAGIVADVAGTHVLVSALHAFVYLFPCFLLRQILFRLVNSRLYKSQYIVVKPLRWNALNLTMLSFMGTISLIICSLELFVPLPHLAFHILLAFFVLACLYGEIIKSKSSLFSVRCKLLGIICYLCALEIGPVVLALFLLGTNPLFL